jgi:hypothetical protein
MKTKILLAVGLFAFVAGLAVFAQLAEIKATIDFPFKVEGKVLPAGAYDFVRDDSAAAFRVTDGGKNSAIALIQTRLSSEIHTTPADAHIVFDKIGETCLLSEIWIPGQDGYVIMVTKGPHEHKVVNVKY